MAIMDSPNTGSGRPDDRRNERREPRPPCIVRYGAMRWVGEFQSKAKLELQRDDCVVIQTDRGIELGQLATPWQCNGCACPTKDQVGTYIQNSGPELCRPRAGRVLRKANDQDVSEHEHLNAHVKEDVNLCAELAEQHTLDLRVVTAEHLLGGERIVFYFTAPDRVDFRLLVKDLAQRYRTRIEMRQVRPRDEARLVADYEICGRECCCKNFLKRLRPVSMKMAKLQKSTLDPSKVSGRCGLLRCCLRYENDGYEELDKRLPRNGTRVRTEDGPATVIDRQVLTQLLMVRTDDDRVIAVPFDEVLETNIPPQNRNQSAPTGRHAASLRQRQRRNRPPRMPTTRSSAASGRVAAAVGSAATGTNRTSRRATNRRRQSRSSSRTPRARNRPPMRRPQVTATPRPKVTTRRASRGAVGVVAGAVSPAVTNRPMTTPAVGVIRLNECGGQRRERSAADTRL
jgi:cell fate regulator YaaT (PSP1 superfamily)